MAIAYKQTSPNDEPFLSVDKKQVRTKNISAKVIEEKHFSIGSEDEAVKRFKEHLADTIEDLDSTSIILLIMR